ncbi:MAG: hypothetical protein FWF57_08695 [Defluviitaleaceae bacterium]|nr:hypothetical protein [Defluviitaleaceae bacterium]
MNNGKEREIVKSIFLVFLVVLAIFQTGELWLSNMSHNFFVFFTNRTNTSYHGDRFIAPSIIFTSGGRNRFVAEHSPVLFYTNFWDIIVNSFSNEPRFIGSFNTNILNNSIIYYYNFSMPVSAIFEHFNIDSNNISDHLESFNKIVIRPSTDSSNTAYIYFIYDNIMAMYEANISQGTHNNLTSTIQNAHMTINNQDIYYVSSDIMGFNFSRNVFLPRWQGQFFSYNLVKSNDILYSANLSTINQIFRDFFDNSSPILSDYIGNEFIIGDNNIVVRYREDENIVRYTNHSFFSRNDNNVLSDFSIAFEFINNLSFNNMNSDKKISFSGFYHGYDYRIFYFDYVINNIPIFLINDSKRHFIEVTVRGGSVSNFSQFMVYFKNSNQTFNFTKDIIDLVNEQGNNIIPALGYIYNSNINRNDISIEWVILN